MLRGQEGKVEFPILSPRALGRRQALQKSSSSAWSSSLPSVFNLRQAPPIPASMAPTKTGIRYGLNSGRVVAQIPKSVKPSQRKGIQSHKTQVVRSVIREVSPSPSHIRPTFS